jgi:hypothetical protein
MCGLLSISSEHGAPLLTPCRSLAEDSSDLDLKFLSVQFYALGKSYREFGRVKNVFRYCIVDPVIASIKGANVVENEMTRNICCAP